MWPPVFMPTVGNGLDRSAKQPIYSRAGALLPPQTGIPEGSLPRGEGGFFAARRKRRMRVSKQPGGQPPFRRGSRITHRRERCPRRSEKQSNPEG